MSELTKWIGWKLWRRLFSNKERIKEANYYL